MNITINNLQKTYKVKNGEDVHALKGISFELPVSGMVFVLGKSGCGKSTLLNLLGGLDGFDGGDIIVDGKSMKEFSPKDYENYRNNFVGFVFQENNLLNEYSVKYNVGLALDLQKEKRGKLIESALDSVGLKEHIERKCNRLSGGQKQRVAIARAIIKKPKMLLCDEPTGSLDSETGEDIFNLLKEISKDTLVVVVTHDRDAAKTYGDRTIEIKDGEIVSDSGFNAEEKEITPQSFKKRRGLPLTRALGLGASFLIARPFRLALCVLICIITFTCVGIADTFTAYDKGEALVKNMDYYKNSFFAYKKWWLDNDNNPISFQYLMSPNDTANLESIVEGPRVDNYYHMAYAYEYKNRYHYTTNSISQINQENKVFKLYGYVVMDESLPKDYGFEFYGSFPKASDEVVISKHIYKGFEKYGYTVGENTYAVSEYDDIIGKSLTISCEGETFEYQYTFKVVGILDTKFNEDFYKKFNEDFYSYITYGGLTEDFGIMNMMGRAIYSGMQNALFTSAGFREEMVKTAIERNPKLNAENLEDIKHVFAPYTGSHATKVKNASISREKKFKTEGNEREDYCTYDLVGDVGEAVRRMDDKMNGRAQFFLYVTIGATALSVLLLLYFTSGVVAEKERQIGILRALGASRGDIIKIFGAENGIVAAAVIAISSVISAVCMSYYNASFLKREFYLGGRSLIAFSFRQFSILFAVAVFTIAVGIAIPLIRLLLKKPVDLIAERRHS